MIVILPVTGANLTSVANAMDQTGVPWIFSDDPGRIKTCARLIIPGVGNARTCMERLVKKNLPQIISDLTVPVLGICIGMQILFTKSEEYPDGICLGVIPGSVKKLPPGPGLPVPHMGWNQLEITENSALFRLEDSGAWVYYVHSYHSEDGPFTTAVSQYGIRIPAGVQYRNFTGLQFHPEKSGQVGLNILKRFVKYDYISCD